MIYSVVKAGNPVLRKQSKAIGSVDKKVIQLINDLTETLIVQSDPEGVGLAAPQIGISLRVFVARIGGHILPFINPEIISSSNEGEESIEGCLSIHDYYGTVKRSLSVTIRAQNKHGKLFTRTYKGLYARIMQHETDHLNGVLYVDRVSEQKGTFYELIADTLHPVSL